MELFRKRLLGQAAVFLLACSWLSALPSSVHADEVDAAAAAPAAAAPAAEAVAAEPALGPELLACIGALKQVLQPIHPHSAKMVEEVEAFAKEHNLPTKVLELGPKQRKVKRLVVGLDYNNADLMKAYMEKFHLDGPLGDGHAGTLVLEFQNEIINDYVTGVLRPSPKDEENIYRWGRPDLSHNDWWKEWLLMRGKKHPSGIVGFSHMIGLSEDELKNVHVFLDNPKLRAPCKSDNCVAWTSTIELGKTAEGASNAERKFLFEELGMSRSMAHFEIGRRLVNAANERHAAMFAFLDGERGLQGFQKLPEGLPPDPKIPYRSILKNVEFGPEEALMAALSRIPDGGKVFFPIAAGASPEAFDGLVARALEVDRGFDVHVLVNGISENTMRKAAEAPNNKIRLRSLFLGGNQRVLNAEGKVSVIPGYLSDFTRWVKAGKNGFDYDAIVVRVSPPDLRGRYSLGPNNDMIMSIIRNRPNIKIIAEINPNVPFTTGENYLSKNQFAATFESKSALAGPPVVPVSDVDKLIGMHLAQLVESGSTLQIGIGNIFGGFADAMKAAGREKIEIWTEMFGDAQKQMMQDGVAKKATTGFAYGSDDLYKWLDKNKDVVFEETEVVNNPGTVAEKKKFHAVNTALQVNLRGDVNATMGPAGRISSPGGQVEFMSGAARSEGGKAIIAIRSTAKGDTVSTITLDLYAGPITTPHESVTHVVTEYGVADLAGKSEEERALALIAVAHPKFRAELLQQALDRKIISQVVFNNYRWRFR